VDEISSDLSFAQAAGSFPQQLVHIIDNRLAQSALVKIYEDADHVADETKQRKR
jgi:hypothetical protein